MLLYVQKHGTTLRPTERKQAPEHLVGKYTQPMKPTRTHLL
jgi:hypothetical protein